MLQRCRYAAAERRASKQLASPPNTERGPSTQRSVVDAKGWRDTYACVGPHNPLRRWCDGIIAHPSFNHFILVIILFSSAALAFESPRLDPSTDMAFWLEISDYFVVVVFSVELFIKVSVLARP